MKRSAPMKRTGFTAKIKPVPGLLRTSQLRKACKPMKKSVFRSSKPKSTPIRKSARGEECTLNLPGVCNFDPETTVLCHENGAGAGMKSLDEFGVYGCYACHMVLDGQAPRPAGLTRDAVQAAFVLANEKTREILKRKGLLP